VCCTIGPNPRTAKLLSKFLKNYKYPLRILCCKIGQQSFDSVTNFSCLYLFIGSSLVIRRPGFWYKYQILANNRQGQTVRPAREGQIGRLAVPSVERRLPSNLVDTELEPVAWLTIAICSHPIWIHQIQLRDDAFRTPILNFYLNLSSPELPKKIQISFKSSEEWIQNFRFFSSSEFPKKFRFFSISVKSESKISDFSQI